MMFTFTFLACTVVEYEYSCWSYDTKSAMKMLFNDRKYPTDLRVLMHELGESCFYYEVRSCELYLSGNQTCEVGSCDLYFSGTLTCEVGSCDLYFSGTRTYEVG